MTADEYRRKGFEAQRQAALATNPLVKDGSQLLGQEWLALAEQVEWIERRYGSAFSRWEGGWEAT
jgi:hypothetical protein